MSKQDPAVAPSLGVLVLGMHRSGTSAVAGALAAAGFHLGSDEHLAPGLPQNPAGFFEHSAVVDFDDRLLADLGWAWDAPDPLPLSRPPLLNERVEEGRALVASHLLGSRPWATKDPRISVLLPWWRRILLDRFVSIVCVRRPEEVAWSLAVIYGFPIELGLALWATYHRHLAAGLDGLPVIGVDYGGLTDQPARVVPELLARLDSLGVHGSFDIEAAIASVKPDLRRATQPASAAPVDAVMGMLNQIHALWSPEPVWLKERFAISRLPVEGWERALVETNRRAREEERLRASLADEGRTQAEQVEAIKRELTAAQAELSASQTEREGLAAETAVSRDRAGALAAQLTGLHAERDALTIANTALQGHVQALAAQLASAEEYRQAGRDELTAHLAAAAEARVRHEEELGRLRSELDVSSVRLGELHSELEQARARQGVSGSVRILGRSVRGFGRAVRQKWLRGLIKLVPPTLLAYVWHNPLFDRQWYLDRYADVLQKRMNPERHFRRHGAREGRNPNALFDTAWYITRYPDVPASSMNPLDHYLVFGAHESRNPGPGFATDWYMASNPDVQASGMNPLLHYLRHGAAEGRPPTDGAPGEVALESGDAPTHTAAIGPRRLLLIVHDAHNHGAQQAALHLARELARRFGFLLDIVLLGEGALWPEFERMGHVHDFARKYVSAADQARLLRELRDAGVEVAMCNTTVTGRLVPALKSAGFRVITLVHELPQLIHDYGLEDAAKAVAEQSDAVVFASDFVRDAFESVAHGDMGVRAHVRPQGLYRKPDAVEDGAALRASVRRDLELSPDAEVVLAVGFADQRKGFDLFVDVFARVAAVRSNVAFVWLGCENRELIDGATRKAREIGAERSLRLLPRVPDVNRYYAVADVLLLPSREDPYPSVVLEAMSHGLPTIAFAEATGVGELLERGCGLLVPRLDTAAMADAVVRLLVNPELRLAMGSTGSRIVSEEFDWTDYVFDLLDLAGFHLRRVSVVVPNYNYAHHLRRRLESIFGQDHPIREVIVIDDASSDDSLAVLETLKQEKAWDFAVVRSSANSGSVFRQWLRGVSRARSDLVWIAEADDFAEPAFLSRLVTAFDNRRVVMAYSESRQVDEEGAVMAPDYLDYVRDIDPSKWTQSWTRPGLDELAESFAVRNTVPNASAVLFDRAALLEALEQNIELVTDLHVAGDYAVYVNMLLTGRHLAFVAEPLNNHRRHARSVTTASYGEVVVSEIARLQRLVQAAVPVRPEVRDQARQYLAQLCTQFQLSPDFPASLITDPRVPTTA